MFDLITRNLKHIAAAAIAAAIGLAAVNSFAQENKGTAGASNKDRYTNFCSSENWSGDNVSYRDLREMTIPATGSVDVNAGQNGGINVRGEERSDVLVRACVQAWGPTEAEAKSRVSAVIINTAGTIKADSPAGDKNWSVSYQILVPRSTNLRLAAHNGGIAI
jgi:hypothetical protein